MYTTTVSLVLGEMVQVHLLHVQLGEQLAGQGTEDLARFAGAIGEMGQAPHASQQGVRPRSPLVGVHTRAHHPMQCRR